MASIVYLAVFCFISINNVERLMVNCRKITFEMEEDGTVWESVFLTHDVLDMTLNQRFIPENASEEILIKIIRRNRQSEEYAAYINLMSNYHF